ncbi:dolichol monophosphate mannose synthase [Candidatus Magnetomorum sp. HK-1]|nr:dolichol monophosphate mannose synthase [Candidatus Magnetomorum sp. HK-1]
MKKIFNVSVVLPTYNERENIQELIQRIEKSLGDRLLEIIVVDDDSPDLTWEIVKKYPKKSVKLIHRLKKKGLSSAILDGIKTAKGSMIVWMDCDLSMPPEIIPDLILELNSNDICIASRYAKGGKDIRSFPRVFMSMLINKFAILMLGKTITDYTSGFVAVKKHVFNNITWNTTGYGEYFIEFANACIVNNYRVIEFGYTFQDRCQGESKSTGNLVTFIKYGFKYLLTIIKLWHKNQFMKHKGKGDL